MFKTFEELSETVKGLPTKPSVAVVMAQDEHTLQAISRAVNEGLIEADLIGDVPAIESILAELGEDKAKYTIIQKDTVE
ncbi:MAG: phosphate butyryltransferase, partial [Lachnospiraceae bacterium]|nr:phosphate butyryltransferase [Lachnospiraceae bacterium]